MKQLAAHASLQFWHSLSAGERARTLALDRFAFLPLTAQNGQFSKDTADTGYRQKTSEAVAGGAVLREGSSAWLQFLLERLCLQDDQVLFGQLQSRLMVNMAGGVLENGGLCLDRRTGLPYIPGSAVKGCARRLAIQQLLARSVEHSAAAETLASFLAEIALTFGWTDSEWKAGRRHKREGKKIIQTDPHSDFWWAMAADGGDHSADEQRNARWAEVSEKTAEILFKTLQAKPRETKGPLALQLPNYAGAVSFLSAWPVEVNVENLPAGAPPTLGKLELDVVTCHHGKYYNDDPAFASAPDTENPVPVVFPAVAPAHVFVFALKPFRGCSPALVDKARTWLAEGLDTLGLGAKTAAGYSWFADVRQQVMPWWQPQVAVARLKTEHRDFATYADTLKDEVVLKLSEQPAVCKAWSANDPASFEPIRYYSTSQGIPLV